MIGAPFYCTISEYVRTITFQVPRFQVPLASGVSPIVIKGEPDFRASITTEPASFIRNGTFLKTYISDADLEEKLGVSVGETGKWLYIVLQIKQDLGMFRATDGQCRKIEDDGIERVFIVDCGAPHVPIPEDRAVAIDAVLTGVQMAFDFTEPFSRLLDKECYFTDEGRELPISRIGISAAPQVVSRIAPERATELAHKSKASAEQLEKAITNGKPRRGSKTTACYGSSLSALLATLQAEPTNDDAYRQLWFLMLYDRADKFGGTCKWQVPNDKSNDMPAITKHRNDVAHPGVERLDGRLARKLIQNILRVLVRKT